MPRSNNILLVEGDSDKKLFEAVCEDLNLRTQIRVAPPKEIAGMEWNTKGGMFNIVPSIINQMADAQTRSFAAVMDADHPDETGMGGGMGCTETIRRFSDTVAPFGYSRVNRAGMPDGIFYGHDNGLNDIGLWVMPNNRDNGITEDWFRRCIVATEVPLVGIADRAVANLPVPRKFKDIKNSKAQVATWLAWQKIPGQGLSSAFRADLMDKNSDGYRKLAAWLRHMFG